MYKGKAIYNPSGKASEYSEWACNTHVGCIHECSYCYLKKGRGAKILGGNKPKLKKCFKDLDHALEVFSKELHLNLDELSKKGLFFSFTTDPLISYIGGDEDPFNFTKYAVGICSSYKVPVKLLTKCGGEELIERIRDAKMMEYWDINLVSIGFSLTGHDNLEPNANTNAERIYAMKILKEIGYKTFASIEPIIDFPSASNMIESSLDYCDLFKVGLKSGGTYNADEAREFVAWLYSLNKPKIYMKESLQKLTGITNRDNGYYFVDRDYNMFKA